MILVSYSSSTMYSFPPLLMWIVCAAAYIHSHELESCNATCMPSHWCRSQYLIKGILRLPTPEGYAFDMCDNGQCPHVYGAQLTTKERLKTSGERCPNCGSQRYCRRNNQVFPARRWEPNSMVVLLCLFMCGSTCGSLCYTEFPATLPAIVLP